GRSAGSGPRPRGLRALPGALPWGRARAGATLDRAQREEHGFDGEHAVGVLLEGDDRIIDRLELAKQRRRGVAPRRPPDVPPPRPAVPAGLPPRPAHPRPRARAPPPPPAAARGAPPGSASGRSEGEAPRRRRPARALPPRAALRASSGARSAPARSGSARRRAHLPCAPP